MKILVMKDEMYPYYIVDTTERPYSWYAKPAEMTDEEWEDYRRVSDAFHKWQDRLEELYEGTD